MADQQAVPQDHAFRHPGRSRRERKQRGIVRTGIRRDVVGRCLVKLGMKIDRTAFRPADQHHMAKVGQQIAQAGHRRIAQSIGHHEFGAGDLQALHQAVGINRNRDRYADHAGAPACQMDHQCFGRLVEKERHAIAAHHAICGERVGCPARQVEQLGKTETANRAILGFVNQGDRIRGFGGNAIAHIERHVVAQGYLPAEPVVDFPIGCRPRKDRVHPLAPSCSVNQSEARPSSVSRCSP